MRWPIIPTIFVGLAVVTMISLGIWQLDRKGEKEAAIALMEKNLTRPAMAFPEVGPVADEAMFRSSKATCLEVVDWRDRAGTDINGKAGILYIAECKTGADGPGFLAAMGIADRPNEPPGWNGGEVSGIITREPATYSAVEKLFSDIPPLRPMLVASEAPEGMRQVAKPTPASITNNHLSYALQWFFFAMAAAVIYVLALRKRQKSNTN